MKPPLYVCGVPGNIGGAATKIRDMLPKLALDFDVSIILVEEGFWEWSNLHRYAGHHNIPIYRMGDLPSRLDATVLTICEPAFFSSGTASTLKDKGARIVFANCMMWQFSGESDAVKQGLIDRILFNSEFQKEAFASLYDLSSVQWQIVDNYINPDRFPFYDRSNRDAPHMIGRLSRADPVKYSENFPLFYEGLGVPMQRFRVMGWSEELTKRYSWHRFSQQWELLPAGAESANAFLNSLDLFVYFVSHSFRESWGRVVVEAMLTGCVPLVPTGHHFEALVNDGENGFVCSSFEMFRARAQQVSADRKLWLRLSKAASAVGQRVCDWERHRRIWLDVLKF